MAVSGDFVRLRLLQDRLRQVANGEARSAMLRELSNEARRQMLDCFKEQRDPYGRPWRARKRRDDNHPLLNKTGRLINSLRSSATATGFRITGLDYGNYLELGTDKMWARMFAPRPDMGFGAIWGDAFLRVSSALARRLIGIV